MDSEGEDEQMALAIAQSLELNYNQQIATAANPKLKRKSREGQEKSAIPLCLPNNWDWNSRKRKCVKTSEERCSLYVINEALEQLRKIKGPVCVVSIAGPYRKGKSYILSDAFDQPEVFPLGHEMVAETMGIWLWIVPGKYKDSNGREFTVVLLDSEGIDSTLCKGSDDHQIFTLTVLLASVLIYNSVGVPTRDDANKLDFIVNLSQRIQIRSNSGLACRSKDTEYFHKTFPYFIWLLRDVTQSIPPDCENIKDYFLKKVFKDQDSAGTACQSRKVGESILRFFPGFDAFMLPPPTVDREVMKSLNKRKSQINPSFVSGVDEFKRLIRATLAPKRSFTDGEFVTGEGLAALVQLYVEAVNSPGAIPNVQRAWDTFVATKCSEAKEIALGLYDVLLTSQLSRELPCDSNKIRFSHNVALQESEEQFMVEVAGICTDTVETYMIELKNSMASKMLSWQAENERQTREYCEGLLSVLKGDHLDPVLQRLQGKEAAKVSYTEVIGGYNRVKDDYEASAKGAKDVIATVFFEFHPQLLKVMEQYLGLLRQLKDFDEDLSRELAAKAYQERERKRLEEQQHRLQQENRELKEQMQMLMKNLDEENRRLREQMEDERNGQRRQLADMMAANIKQAQEERLAFIKENDDLRDRFKAAQELNEENMRKIKQMSEIAAKQEKEKGQLLQQLKYRTDEDKEALIKEINGRHEKEMKELRNDLNTRLDDTIANVPKVEKGRFLTPGLIDKRTKTADDLRAKIEETHQAQQEVEKPGVMKTILNFVSKAVPAAGAVASAVCPVAAPIVVPITALVGAAAGFVAENICSIM